MNFRTIIGLLIVLIVSSCSQRSSKGEKQMGNDSTQRLLSKSGLLIDHKGYHGTEYTDSLGINYKLKTNPITITNDSTIAIHVQLAFYNEYEYPITYGEEKYKVFSLPREWAIDGLTDSLWKIMFEKLPYYLDHPFLINETLEPGDNIVLAIGTLYPEPSETWSVVPNELFVNNDEGIFPHCDWITKDNPSSIPKLDFRLKLNFVNNCMIIPCGQISYLER